MGLHPVRGPAVWVSDSSGRTGLLGLTVWLFIEGGITSGGWRQEREGPSPHLPSASRGKKREDMSCVSEQAVCMHLEGKPDPPGRKYQPSFRPRSNPAFFKK